MSDRSTSVVKRFAEQFKAEWELINGRKEALSSKYSVVAGEVSSLLGQISGKINKIAGMATSLSDARFTYDFKSSVMRHNQSIESPLGNFLISIEYVDNRAIWQDDEFSAADPARLPLAIASKAVEHFTKQLPRTL